MDQFLINKLTNSKKIDVDIKKILNKEQLEKIFQETNNQVLDQLKTEEVKEKKIIEPKEEIVEPVMEFKDPIFKELTEEELKTLESEISSEDVEQVSLENKKKKDEEIKKLEAKREEAVKEKEAEEVNMEKNILEQVKSGDPEFDAEMEKLLNFDDGDEEAEDDF